MEAKWQRCGADTTTGPSERSRALASATTRCLASVASTEQPGGQITYATVMWKRYCPLGLSCFHAATDRTVGAARWPVHAAIRSRQASRG